MKSLRIDCEDGGQKARVYIDGREIQDVLSIEITKSGLGFTHVVIHARVTGEVQVGSE